MLCEKCHRRQTEWGTICEECEKAQAVVERRQDIVRFVRHLKWFALWMTADFVVLWGIILLFSKLCGMPAEWMIGILALMLLTLAFTLREWWLWRGCSSRLNKGEFQQVAYDLLHHPKGFWRSEIRGDFYIQSKRRRSGIGGMVMYCMELRYLHEAEKTLEMLADDMD